MNSRLFRSAFALAAMAGFAFPAFAQEADKNSNWYSWRGPNQNGTSNEHYEGWGIEEEPVWTKELKGGSTPVVVDGRLINWAYVGETTDLYEVLTAYDAATGEEIWSHKIFDFLSDTAYNRYAIGSPTVDPETKNIYLMTTNGYFLAFDFDGKPLWNISMMERFGRLTFPNGRAGCPVIEGNMVIVRGITSNWGADGPARDRFYAFDKITGELIWSSTPGIGPMDSSFSTPVFETRYGMRVFYSGTGCGNMVCVNAYNGKPLWRFHAAKGGINVTPLIHGDKVIYSHDVENLDSSESGRMVAVAMPEKLDESGESMVLPADAEVWRNPISMFTSSGVVVGDRIYQIDKTGNLNCVNAESGEIIWKEKLGPDNIHSSPLYVDGVLYVPINEGVLHICKPDDNGANVIQKIAVEGTLLGAPTVYNGHMYLQSKAKFYCFKIKHTGLKVDPLPKIEVPEAGAATALQVIPSEVLLYPGAKKSFRVRSVDASGFKVADVAADSLSWEKFIPPTAKVKVEFDGNFNEAGELVAEEVKNSAGAFKATSEDGLNGIIRGRILSDLPYEADFEGFELTEDGSAGKFAYPPLPWIGARFKFEIQEKDGSKVLAKTLDRVLFQRGQAFFAEPMSNYTMQADVMTDGNRRLKSDVGLLHQRYTIILKGNWNQIEVSSNHERFKESAEFPISANTWYTLKSRVESKEDGSGAIRVKAWKRGEEEPDGWNLEVDVPIIHREGAPGIYGFALQSQKAVYVDNIKVTPNE